MRRTLLLALLPFLFIGCGKHPLLEETHNFNNQTWMRFEPEQYQFQIKNADDCYDIRLRLRVDTTVFTANELPLIIDLYNSNDEHRNFSVTARVHNSNGTLNGTRLAQFVDIDVPAKKYFFFNSAGIQRIEVKQATSHYELPGINALTVTVQTSDMSKK